MPYVVHLKRSAEKELSDLPWEVQQRIIKRLLALKDNPWPPGAKKLWEGERYRIKVGNYRVLYTIDDALQKIEVSAVGHRREVYR
jgi:mRNA interferase RelE/StbE